VVTFTATGARAGRQYPSRMCRFVRVESAPCDVLMSAGLRLLYRWAVVLGSSGVDIGQVSACPFDQGGHRLEQGASGLRQVVIDPRGDDWVHGSGDEPVAFQRAKRHGEHARGDPFDGAVQLAELQRAVPEKRDDIERDHLSPTRSRICLARQAVGLDPRLQFETDSHRYLMGSEEDLRKQLWFM
jgi:hypothetical protein